MSTLSSAHKPWPPRSGRRAGGSSIIIRGFDIPRDQLAALQLLQYTNQVQALDADAEVGSCVAQSEGQEEEVEGFERATRPVTDPDSGAPRGFDRRRSDTDETVDRPTLIEPMSKDIHHAGGTALANPRPRRRVQRRQTRPGRRAKVARPGDPAKESNA